MLRLLRAFRAILLKLRGKSGANMIDATFASLAPVYVEVGGPQIGEVTCNGSPHLSCKRDQIKMRDVDRQVTPPKRATSPTEGAPHKCKQALIYIPFFCMRMWHLPSLPYIYTLVFTYLQHVCKEQI